MTKVWQQYALDSGRQESSGAAFVAKVSKAETQGKQFGRRRVGYGRSLCDNFGVRKKLSARRDELALAMRIAPPFGATAGENDVALPLQRGVRTFSHSLADDQTYMVTTPTDCA